MELPKSKVYIKVDGNIVTACDGGYTMPKDLTGWIFIDEGYGDKYNLCQSNYFEKPISNIGGSHNYRYENGVVREATEQEKADEIHDIPVQPTDMDRIEAQVMYTALMTDTLLEEE